MLWTDLTPPVAGTLLKGRFRLGGRVPGAPRPEGGEVGVVIVDRPGETFRVSYGNAFQGREAVVHPDLATALLAFDEAVAIEDERFSTLGESDFALALARARNLLARGVQGPDLCLVEFDVFGVPLRVETHGRDGYEAVLAGSLGRDRVAGSRDLGALLARISPVTSAATAVEAASRLRTLTRHEARGRDDGVRGDDPLSSLV